MIDFYVFPFAERVIMLQDSPWRSGFESMEIKDQCPLMYEYVHNFRSHPTMNPYVIPQKAYNKFLDKFSMQEPNSPVLLDIEVLK